MLLPNRHHNTPDYRYGFQGQEMDDEVKGEGNSLNYTFRMHDPRVGRFFAVDPITSEYPELTPYQFSSNSPIYMLELEGLEGVINPLIPGDSKIFMTAEGRAVTKSVFQPVIEFFAGLVPWIAQGIDSKDTYEAFDSGSNVDKVFAAVGWVPGGDVLKGAKKTFKSVSNIIDGTKSLEKASPSISKIDDAIKGGKYGALEPKSVTGKEKHHIPANAASPLSTYKGGAVQIDPSDHKLSASYGSSKSAKAYRAKQKQLIDSGDFKGAFEMDVKDLSSKFGKKYDDAIEQTRKYYKSEGIIKN
ncbi:MAG: hypothetical protein COB98_09900 [Flavobacteriaceae bacterium]|nr:MAG: hypothetical protein COB98_09900 [Flavobacteriaceae bacterium]